MKVEDFLDWYRENEETAQFIEPKDAYERTWACHDFELSHLWQRSVFLAVFLLAIAGAYGTLLLNMYFPGEQNEIFIWDWDEKTIEEDRNDIKKATKKIEYKAKNTTWQQHAIASGVCWLGISFSILWVMMAKGSKYWFERYEAGINAFEDGDAGKKLAGYPHHGDMSKLKPHQFNENIFSPKSGHYSVSKVNGTIGIISLTAFSFLEMFHFGKFLGTGFDELNNLQCALFAISQWLFCGAVLFAVLRFLCKSGAENE